MVIGHNNFQNVRRFFMGLAKPLRFIVIFLIITGWVYSGWPQIPFLNFPPKVQEAYALIAVQNDATEVACTNASTCAVTLDVPSTATMVVVAVMVRNAETITSVTDGDGDTYSVASSQGTDPTVAIYFATTITANASKSITANLSASTADTVIDAYTLTGTETTSPIDATATATGSGATANANITTNNNDSLIAFVAGLQSNGGVNTLGTGQLQRGSVTVGGQVKYAGTNTSEITTSSGNNDQTVTWSKSATWRAVAVEIKIAAAVTTLTQNDFEFFVDNNALLPTDVWGNPDIAENVAVDAVPPSNDPIDKGDHIRLRMNISVTDAQLDAGAEGFILQYARASDCTTGPSWTDVDAFGTAGATWRFFDNGSITDDTALDGATLTLDSSDEEGRYSESDPTGTNPVAVPAGQELEWDWNIEYDGTGAVDEARTYCFRMRKDDPADLDGYNSDSFPRIDIRPSTADQLRHGNFFTEGVERGFFWAD
ncbi:hypothetical protein IH982_00010 [Patescibacteria group bacterium]|nr:hypothetical protein [Patescibacteria group bacterium]